MAKKKKVKIKDSELNVLHDEFYHFCQKLSKVQPNCKYHPDCDCLTCAFKWLVEFHSDLLGEKE